MGVRGGGGRCAAPVASQPTTAACTPVRLATWAAGLPDLTPIPALFKQDLLPFLPGINAFDLLGQHDGRLKQFFKDPRLRAMFTFQAGPRAHIPPH